MYEVKIEKSKHSTHSMCDIYNDKIYIMNFLCAYWSFIITYDHILKFHHIPCVCVCVDVHISILFKLSNKIAFSRVIVLRVICTWGRPSNFLISLLHVSSSSLLFIWCENFRRCIFFVFRFSQFPSKHIRNMGQSVV